MKLGFERSVRLLSVVSIAGLGVALGSAVACNSISATDRSVGYCDCVATAFVDLELPVSARADVTAIEVSGPACSGPIEVCDRTSDTDLRQVTVVGESGCASVTINAHDDGLCHIAVKFRHRPSFETDVTFTTPPDPPCGPVCSRRPLGLDGGALAVPDEPLVAGDASADAGSP